MSRIQLPLTWRQYGRLLLVDSQGRLNSSQHLNRQQPWLDFLGPQFWSKLIGCLLFPSNIDKILFNAYHILIEGLWANLANDIVGKATSNRKVIIKNIKLPSASRYYGFVFISFISFSPVGQSAAENLAVGSIGMFWTGLLSNPKFGNNIFCVSFHIDHDCMTITGRLDMHS